MITKGFHVITGGDGSGKSTILARIKKEKGERVEIVSSHYFHPLFVLIAVYCGIPPSPFDFEKMMRKMPRFSLSIAILLLEALLVDFKVIPAIEKGKIVLMDSYFYKILAREIVRGRASSWTREFFSKYPVPEQVFFVDVDPAIAYSRRGNAKESECGIGRTKGSFVSFQSQTNREIIQLIQTVHSQSKLVLIDGTIDKNEIVQVMLNSI